jgi:amino acid transporter
MLTILGVVFFMRSSFVIGEGGIINAMLILLLAEGIILFTALSICAISTNMQIRGGGAYFMISRVLGPSYGGTIGLALYVAQSLTVVFALVGFTEAILTVFPAIGKEYFLPITLGVLFGVSALVYIGASWATKAQFLIMGVLFVSIAFIFIGGGSKFEASRFQANLHPPVVHTPKDKDIKKQAKELHKVDNLVDHIKREPQIAAKYELLRFVEELKHKDTFTFWPLFAIFFPAVTGILTGVNMSGDLKDPSKSIPRGTLLAVSVGFVIYFAQVIISGGAYERTEMITKPFEVLRNSAFLGAGFLVVFGMVSATLSSAIGDMMGAPRVLQAVARDRILAFLYPFSKGTDKTDEPRRALALTLGFQTLVVIGVAAFAGAESALDTVAIIVTMFYLWTYGMINVAAFIEKISRNPSFRPTFKYFHWSTALLGAIGCVVAAVMINFTGALIATTVVIIIQATLKRRMLASQFGNVMRGFFFERVRTNLIHLLQLPEDNRNWRPTIFVFIGNPKSWETLVTYAVWLDNARGIVRAGNVLIGDVTKMSDQRNKRIVEIEQFAQNMDVSIFPTVAVAPNVANGLTTLLQAESVRPIRSNLAVFGWGDSVRNFISRVRWAVPEDLSFIAIKATGLPEHTKIKRIDLWWNNNKSSSLSLLMAHLLRNNWEWHHSTLRVIVPAETEQKVNQLADEISQLTDSARLEVEIVPLVIAKIDKKTLHEQSSDADCIFINVDLPEDEPPEEWFDEMNQTIKDLPTTILVHSTITTDILA